MGIPSWPRTNYLISRTIEELETPCLLLDATRVHRNIRRLTDRLRRLQVPLRPHLKTAKSIEIAHLLMPSPAGPATVSTLKEAEQFAAAGVRDILYAVGIAPGKLSRTTALRKKGIDLSIILDSREQARAVVTACHGPFDRPSSAAQNQLDGSV